MKNKDDRPVFFKAGRSAFSGEKIGKHASLVQASVTVETALIMPVLLITIMSSLYLTIHVRNGTMITSSCIEQAVSGRHQDSPALFFAGNVERGEEESASHRKITFRAATYYFSGQFLWQSVSERTYKKYYPVTYLRKIRGAGDLLDRVK